MIKINLTEKDIELIMKDYLSKKTFIETDPLILKVEGEEHIKELEEILDTFDRIITCNHAFLIDKSNKSYIFASNKVENSKCIMEITPSDYDI